MIDSSSVLFYDCVFHLFLQFILLLISLYIVFRYYDVFDVSIVNDIVISLLSLTKSYSATLFQNYLH